jgi:hypothetical protein
MPETFPMQFQSPVPSWGLLIFALSVIAMGVLAGSVFLAGRRMEVSRHHVLSFFQMLLWVVPALVVVGLVGMSTRSGREETPTVVKDPAPTPAASDPNLLHSRTTSSEVPTWARPAEGQPKKGVVARFTSGLVRRMKGEGEPHAADWLIFSSSPFVTEDEASREITPKVQSTLEDQLRENFTIPGTFTLSVPMIEHYGVRDSVLESFDKDFGRGPEKMVRLHTAVQITPQFRDAVYQDWKAQAVHGRLMRYAAGVGVGTAILGIIAAYLSLNSVTQGRYPWRLRLAALSGAIAAAAIGLITLA